VAGKPVCILLHNLVNQIKYTDIWVLLQGNMGGGLLDRGSHVSDICHHPMLKLFNLFTTGSITRLVGALLVSFHITQSVVPVSLPLIQNRLMVDFQNPNSKQKVKTYVREWCLVRQQ
jgi:hypothetical protein